MLYLLYLSAIDVACTYELNFIPTSTAHAARHVVHSVHRSCVKRIVEVLHIFKAALA